MDPGQWWFLEENDRCLQSDAGTAWHKGCGHKGSTVKQRWKNQTKDNVGRGTLTGQTFGKGHGAQPECNNSTRNRGLKERLCVGSRRTLNKIFRRTIELEVKKQIA
jgi:hypothetical protein